MVGSRKEMRLMIFATLDQMFRKHGRSNRSNDSNAWICAYDDLNKDDNTVLTIWYSGIFLKNYILILIYLVVCITYVLKVLVWSSVVCCRMLQKKSSILTYLNRSQTSLQGDVVKFCCKSIAIPIFQIK